MTADGGTAEGTMPSNATNPDGGDPLQCDDVVSTDLEPAPAELMVVADRSASMSLSLSWVPSDRPGRIIPPPADSPDVRWNALQRAFNALVPEWNALGFKLGLATFPAPESGRCDIESAPRVSLGTSPSEITSALDAAGPTNGNTPTFTALGAVSTYLDSLPAASNPRMILLVTDGQPNCGGDTDDVVSMVTSIRERGVDTVVLGITPPHRPLDATLDRIANAGGQPRLGEPKFYRGDSQDALERSLREITQSASDCRFVSPQTINGADITRVFIGDREVPGDQWMHDGERTVALLGQACADSKTQTGRVRMQTQECVPRR